MDYIILYNPLSKGGANIKNSNKLKKKLEKKNHTVEVGSLIDIKDVKSYIEDLDPKTNIVIIGGDGTLHYLANVLIDYKVKNNLFVMRAGTGNDFVRSLKSKEKLVRINDFIEDIPYDLVEEDDNKNRYFLNSAGMGIDAYIGHLVNENEKSKGSWSYFKSAYKAFTKFKPYDLEMELAGETLHFKKTWLAVVANSKYLGRGMKISPKSERLDDTLEVIVVHGLPRIMLLFLFPLIYLGWHMKLKRWIKSYECQEVILKSDTDKYVQYDGETHYPRRKIHVFRR